MKLVTWNTRHGGKRTDDKLDTAGLGKHLASFNADIICLQEVEQDDGYGNDDKVSKWLTALGDGWRGVFVNLSGIVGGSGQGNAILFKEDSSYSVYKLGLYDLRVALAVQFGNTFFVTTHLDNEAQKSRMVEMVQLLSWSVVHDAPKIVICGDFNAGPTTPEMLPLGVLYNDASSYARAKTGLAYTHGKSSRIDYVFSKGMTPTLSYDVPDLKNVNGIYPSDHHPVIVTW